MPLTPEQEAEIRASMTRTPIVPDQSISGRVAGSLGRALQNPAAGHVLGSMVAPGVGPMLAQAYGPQTGAAIAPPGAVQTTPTEAAPFNENVGGFAPKFSRPGEAAPLQPMNTPLVDVQAAPQLTMPQVGHPTGGGGFLGGDNGIGAAQLGYNGAQGRRVGLIGKEADLSDRLGVAAADRTDAVADLNEADAAKKQAEAERAARVEAEVQSGMNDFFKQNQAMVDDIAGAKVDRRRLFANQSTGDKFLLGLGAAFGGMLRGLQGGGTNSFLDYVERAMDADVKDQIATIDNKKSALASRQNMFGQLLQQTGDRRTAEMMLRNLQYEAAKQKLQADADRAGIPEMNAKTDIARNAIEQKQADLMAVLAAEQLKQKQAAAAAAANARAAAEEKAWKRQMEVAHLGLERDKLAIEAGKATGTTQKDLDEKVQKLGTALSDPTLTKGRASLDRLLGQLEKTKKGDQIEGFGLSDRIIGGLPLGQHIASEQALQNKQDWEALVGAYTNIRTGSGGGEKEMAQIRAEAEGMKTPAERANFLRKMGEEFSRREEKLRAAAGTDASRELDRRELALRSTMPASVQVKKPEEQPANPWLRK